MKLSIIPNLFNNKYYRIFAMLILGFASGGPLALYGSTLTMWLSRLGVDIKTIGLFSLVALPFSFKFIWAPIFDNIKLPFLSSKLGLRKSWLVLMQILLVAAIIFIGETDPSSNIKLTAIAAITIAFFSASQDILIDAFRIEVLKQEEQALGASMYVYGYRIAMLVTGAGSLLLAEHLSWGKVYTIMSLTILLGIIAVLTLEESSITKEKLKNTFTFEMVVCKLKEKFFHKEFLIVITFIALLMLSNLYFLPTYLCVLILLASLYFFAKKFQNFIPDSLLDFCNRPQWLTILLFIIFYKYSDTLLDALKSKFYVDYGFSNSEVAIITKGFGFIMTLVGLFVGGLVYYRFKTYKSLFYTLILQMLSNLTFLWVADAQHNLTALTIAIAIENFTGAINTVVMVAYLSSLCNLNYTATQYALLSSFANVGRTIMVSPAGFMVHYMGWKLFIVLTTLVGLPAIFLLIKLKNTIVANEAKS
jgi:MFS transporter, PAT family, beta-lactamase induction signal transducer AmpG